MKKILLLEDDITLSQTIVDYFLELDFDITAVYNANTAQDFIYENNYDLLLLDVNVPDMTGFELLKNIRKENITTPAIFITSLNSMSDLENGFDSGCDDYIRKPFALKELLIRVETILKREFYHTNNDQIKIDNKIIYDTNTNILSIDNTPVQLSNKESILLKLFLQNQDNIISHEVISSALWEYNEEESPSALRTYIKNLRKHLGKEKIVSIKKLGYKFTTK